MTSSLDLFGYNLLARRIAATILVKERIRATRGKRAGMSSTARTRPNCLEPEHSDAIYTAFSAA